jgi:hypothetical protein
MHNKLINQKRQFLIQKRNKNVSTPETKISFNQIVKTFSKPRTDNFKVLRCWWAGDMSQNRFKCITSIYQNSNMDNIELITPLNYKEYEVEEHPIHPGFEYLSAVHQSDYMRIYVSYFHGGAWTDVKYCDDAWDKYFDRIEELDNVYAIGSREMQITPDGRYCNLSEDSPHSYCIGMQQFIVKPKTPIFKTYLELAETKLDLVLEELKKYPGHVHPMMCSDNHIHYTPFPDNLRTYKYPLKWLDISNHFLDAQLPHLDKIIYGMPPPHLFLTGHPHR